jgi:hypothetical protein
MNADGRPGAYFIPEHVLVRAMGEGLLLLDLSSGEYFGLDAVAALIWQGLQRQQRPAEICTSLLARFDVERSVLEGDMATLIERLFERGLLAEAPGE